MCICFICKPLENRCCFDIVAQDGLASFNIAFKDGINTFTQQ